MRYSEVFRISLTDLPFRGRRPHPGTLPAIKLGGRRQRRIKRLYEETRRFIADNPYYTRTAGQDLASE